MECERSLLSTFQRIDYWRQYGDDHPGLPIDDSLDRANQLFQNALVAVASQYPSSLHCSFKRLQKAGMTIATSADHRFRIYSWDTWEGGTMHFFLNVSQWTDGKKSYARAIDASAADPTLIRSIRSSAYLSSLRMARLRAGGSGTSGRGGFLNGCTDHDRPNARRQVRLSFTVVALALA